MRRCDRPETMRGVTLTEVLIVIAIIMVLAAVVAVAFTGVKTAARGARAVSQMRQLWVALKTYQSEYGQDGYYGDPRQMGLPLPWEIEDWRAHAGIKTRDVLVGCGWHPAEPAAGPYSIHYFLSVTYRPYALYAQKWQENLPVFIDMHCTPANTDLENRYLRRYGISVLLAGNAIRRWNTGVFWDPIFWLPPSE